MMISKNENLAVFIDSYDGNRDVWNNFFKVFQYYWVDCPYKRYLVTNEKTFAAENLVIIRTGKDSEWFRCTLSALYKIREKYIFLMLDDYYFSKKICNKDFEEIVKMMENDNIFFYRLSPIEGLDKSKKWAYVEASNVYAINLQPGIWNREHLITYLEELKENGCKTPWDFERYFINKFRNAYKSGFVEGVIYDTRDIMGYKNAIIQGRWVRRVLHYYKTNTDLELEVGNRKMLSIYAEIFDFAKQKTYKYINYENRRKIKILLKKIGFKFVS